MVTQLHLGSETKGVANLLAGKLVEEGKIKWQSRLLAVVPEMKDNIRPEYAAVALDKLLAHASGSLWEELLAAFGPLRCLFGQL